MQLLLTSSLFGELGAFDMCQANVAFKRIVVIAHGRKAVLCSEIFERTHALQDRTWADHNEATWSKKFQVLQEARGRQRLVLKYCFASSVVAPRTGSVVLKYR